MALPAPDRNAFDAATGGRLFTKDFHSALEAVMADEEATASQRVLAWIKRRSWGNYSLHCIEEETGKPALARDCCRELQLDKTRVSHSIADYELRGYVRTEGRLIFPEIEPRKKKEGPKVADSRNFSEFMAWWKVADSRNFSELEVARSQVKRLQKVALSAYKKWRTPQTTAAPSLSETVETVETVNERTGPQRNDTTPEQVRSSLPAPPIRDQIKNWLIEHQDRFGLLTPPDAIALKAVAQHIPDEPTLQRFIQQVEKQKPKPDSWKYFAAIAKACAAGAAASNAKYERLQAKAKEPEERRKATYEPGPIEDPPPTDDPAAKPVPPTQPPPPAQADEEREASRRATAAAKAKAIKAEAEARRTAFTTRKPAGIETADPARAKQAGSK